MASKGVLLNALFDQFISFVNELGEMYPDDVDFPMFATTLKLMRTTNPSLVSKYVYENTIQFEEQISKKDEQFFINYSFDEYGQDVDLNIFSKLKNYVANMNATSKDNVWKYVQNIHRLSKAISSQ
jgi:hypothetical protein